MITRPASLCSFEETIRMPALLRGQHAVILQKVRETGPLLPIEPQYLCFTGQWDGKCDLWDDTLYIIERLVEKYREVSGRNPAVIYLSVERYLAAQTRHYWPRRPHMGKRIPYEYKQNSIYEIVVS